MRLILASLGFVLVLGAGADAQGDPDRDAQPIRPPAPSYPPMALMFRLEGYCEVRFSVDEAGYPFGLSTSCTQPVFCYQSKAAVSKVQFEPKRIDGRVVPRFDVVYPLEYRLGSSDKEIDRSRFGPCNEIAVS